ncbi:TRAP-type C4-dicarboxylate transport system permease small subunit [Cricetibacter osteomyelitidis]|uniref:TRAP transporter small permease protein n=1 Tax=Cricetibacter osteomyelitidis TaxID=1521931 RepID=A0A4R2T8G5_9PAST|nr:TRAP transporter small permease subunit [Cricetibacter osteomyelitidis]TCP93478.1 TRAP-type C4-dicarboxylate transport system permease small subunit [Cricetibacter osteomyelitidis]
MLNRIEQLLAKINNPIAKFGKYIAGFLLAIMTIIVLLQVFYRYLLHVPLSWSDELSCYLMIYMTYLCMPLIYLEDRNIAMTFLTEKIQGKRIYHFLMLIIHLLSLLLFIIWIYFGWLFFLKGNVMANSLPFKMYYIYIVPPVLFAITCLSIIQKIVSELNKFAHYQPIALK